MCGIAGFYRWGEATPPLEALKLMWSVQESRGRDAAGVFWRNEIGVHEVAKRPMPANKLVEDLNPATWAGIVRSPYALFHARAATKGKPEARENNHPVIGYNIAVTHNGVVSNDDDLFRVYKKDRPAEVDSAAINLALSMADTLEDRLRYLTILDGTATFAAVVPDRPESVILARLGYNDLFLFLDDANRILYWSSVAGVGRMFCSRRLGSLAFGYMNQLPDDRILVLNPEGPEAAQAFSVKRKRFVGARLVVNPTMPTPAPITAPTPVGARTLSTTTVSRTNTVVPMSRMSDLAKLVCTKLNAKFDPSVHKGPTLPSPGQFSWDTCELWRAHEEGARGSHAVATAFGHWRFQQGQQPLFRPFKSVRKWWNKRHHGGPRSMPMEGSRWDNKLPLVLLESYERMTGPASWITRGHICPWCGIWQREQAWIRAEGKCPFCLIRSLFPREV